MRWLLLDTKKMAQIMREKRNHKKHDEELLYPMVIAADYAKKYCEQKGDKRNEDATYLEDSSKDRKNCYVLYRT